MASKGYYRTRLVVRMASGEEGTVSRVESQGMGQRLSFPWHLQIKLAKLDLWIKEQFRECSSLQRFRVQTAKLLSH